MQRYKFVRTPNPVYVETEEEAEQWADRYARLSAVGFDTETTGLHKINARIKFFSFSDGKTRMCGPVRLLSVFADILEDPDIEKRFSNAKFDMHMAANHGILIRGATPDSITMDWLGDENRKGRHGLKQTAKDHLGLRMAPFKEVFGSVGSTDKEVEMVARFHDILESGDSDAAAEALVLVGKADGPEDVLQALKKLSLSKQGGYVMDYKKLLAIARKLGLTTRSSGKWSYVSDFLFMLWGLSLPKQSDRAPYVHLIEDKTLITEAHEFMIGKLRERIKIDMEPLEMLKLLVGDYASLDAWGSYTLVEVLSEKLDDVFMDEEDGITLLDYYDEKQCPYTRVLWNMERRGFAFNVEGAEAYRLPMGKEIGRLERSVVAMAGRDVNLNSPTQLRELFYSKDDNGDWVDPFGLPPKYWSKGGASGVKNPSTNKEAIKEWAEKGDQVAEALQEHRVLSKLHGTYLQGVPKWVDHRSRIHTDLKQQGTVTARLSSGDPNLQNIPSRGDWGHRLRQLFVPGFWGDCSPEWCVEELRDVAVPDLPEDTPMTLIVADYEQLEMRIMAHFSGDETMIDAIRTGKDLHSMTAALAGGHDYGLIVAAKKAHDPSPDQRKLIDIRSGFKAVGFGLIYGIGPVKLGRQLGLPIESSVSRRTGRAFEKCPKASELIEQYFDIYPDVKAFIDDTKEACREDLFVQTISKRFRRLPDILSGDGGVRSQAERQSVNSIIQGSAADITTEAMLQCEYDEELRSLGVRMLLQIHDELVFEVPNIPELVSAAMARIKQLMEDPIPMLVPIHISMDTAISWGDAK
jgi:DNA polymerase I-like protein with 3'-5' exonuclease and polymerase domains